MKKILNSLENLFRKSLWAIGLASLIWATTLAVPPSGYAATPGNQSNEKVIQPFELTNPAATRSEAYDDIAKLNKDPKALIEAEMKEEQAEEKAYEQEQREIDSASK
jgi:hypothetical protein